MTLTSDLKAKYCDLWELMTYHPFVSQLGDGSLPPNIFKTYFLQDYVFVNDLVVLAAQAVAKAPNLNEASIFNDFLTSFKGIFFFKSCHLRKLAVFKLHVK